MQRQTVVGWLFLAALILACGVVTGFSVDRGEGMDAIGR